MVAANVLGLYAFDAIGMEFPDVDTQQLQGPGILSMVSAATYVGMMAFYYASILASQVDLENEVRMHKKTAMELRHIAETANRSGTAKSDFVANMSHELRTPLNAVIGYSQMLMDDALIEGDQETADDLDKIQGAGQHLLRLVNDVLDFSKIEAGAMEVSPEIVDLSEKIGGLVEEKRPSIEKGRNRLVLDIDPNVGHGQIDWPLAKKVLSHVIDNAAKFTEAGKIRIAAIRTGPNLSIEVYDNGAGIPEDDLPNLFSAFQATGQETSSKYGGTGIGLALSNRICELLGGQISVQSVLTRGSVFTISFPVQAISKINQNSVAA